MLEELEMDFVRYGRINVATPQGVTRLDLTNARDMGRMLEEYIDDHSPLHLLINLSKISYLSSAALSELIRAKRLCETGGGSLRACGVQADPLKVFQVTNLANGFGCEAPWQANVQEAAEHYNRDLTAS